MPDISDLARIAGVVPERTATQLFGMAVEEFAAQPINTVLQSALGTGEQPVNRNDGSWSATSYAAAFVNSQLRPKLKFMFRVEFLFKPNVLEQFASLSATWKNNFAFMVKSVDRPKVDFEYEDINQYNFHTKVLKRISHKELTITFMDDVGNNVHEFFRLMMMIHSPITRRSAGNAGGLADSNAPYGVGNGMLFSDDLMNINDFANRGVLSTDVGNAIQAIKVTQLYIQPGRSRIDLDTGAKEVSFLFVNPRIVAMDLEDLNHEANEANSFIMQFDYDFMIMGEQETFSGIPPEKSVPPVGTAPGEPSPTGAALGGLNEIGGNNPYTALLAGVGARAAQRITSETLGRSLRTIPGLGSVGDTLGGLVQGITRDRINAFGNINQSAARPTRDVVMDASTAGRDSSSYSTSTGSFGIDQPAPSVDLGDFS